MQVAGQGQRRASFQQARSHETKRSLVQAATALWRANGYARTTVADICRAAGVSKALFYFYFPRKEDVLFEVGVLSTDAAHSVAAEMLTKPYDIPAVIRAVLTSLEDTMRGNPPELIIEAILEGYRQALAGHDHLERTSLIFAEVFERAHRTASSPPMSMRTTWRMSRSPLSARVRGTGRRASTEADPSPRSSAATSRRWLTATSQLAPHRSWAPERSRAPALCMRRSRPRQ